MVCEDGRPAATVVQLLRLLRRHIGVGGFHRLLELLLLRGALIFFKDIAHRGIGLDARCRHGSKIIRPEESDEHVTFSGVLWRLFIREYLRARGS